MKPAAEELRGYLQDVAITASNIPVLHNADVASYSDAANIKDALVRQLYSPVRWVETVQSIRQQGITASAECGPGKVLAGLAKRIVDDMSCFALISQDALDEAQTQFSSSLNQ